MAKDTASLVEAALAGDTESWNALVEEFSGLVWSVIHSLNIKEPDSSDVFQTVFLRLTENLGKVNPVTLPGWLLTVTRRACYDVSRNRQRQPVPTDLLEDTKESPDAGPDELVELSEEEHAVVQGLRRLSARCQQLLRLLASPSEIPYTDIAETLDIPIGSIGPTRARCLEKLKATPELQLFAGTNGLGLVGD